MLIPGHRPHGTRFHCQDTQVPEGRCSLSQTSPPAYRRFRVTSDAEPPGLVPIYLCALVNKGFLPGRLLGHKSRCFKVHGIKTSPPRFFFQSSSILCSVGVSPFSNRSNTVTGGASGESTVCNRLKSP